MTSSQLMIMVLIVLLTSSLAVANPSILVVSDITVLTENRCASVIEVALIDSNCMPEELATSMFKVTVHESL